jgi:hypothetical protein
MEDSGDFGNEDMQEGMSNVKFINSNANSHTLRKNQIVILKKQEGNVAVQTKTSLSQYLSSNSAMDGSAVESDEYYKGEQFEMG